MRVLAALTLALAACADANPAPEVTLLEVTPEEIDPALDAADDVTLRARYRDADADLGGGVAEIDDCRAAALVTRLDLPAIASMAAVEEGVPIEGTLTLVASDVGHTPLDAQLSSVCADRGVPALEPATTVFCLILRDAAGHESPGDFTASITILGE